MSVLLFFMSRAFVLCGITCGACADAYRHRTLQRFERLSSTSPLGLLSLKRGEVELLFIYLPFAVTYFLLFFTQHFSSCVHSYSFVDVVEQKVCICSTALLLLLKEKEIENEAC
jgi:hypothetical protein